jgi:hypothetical protein
MLAGDSFPQGLAGGHKPLSKTRRHSSTRGCFFCRSFFELQARFTFKDINGRQIAVTYPGEHYSGSHIQERQLPAISGVMILNLISQNVLYGDARALERPGMSGRERGRSQHFRVRAGTAAS